MSTALHALLLALALLVALPSAAVLLQVLCALLPRRLPDVARHAGRRPRVAVLVPAHNESTGLLPTLAQVQAQLLPGDRLLVVADNCSDDTADVARTAGADVTVRTDPDHRGKGHALAHGVRMLARKPPEVLIVIDADCTLAHGCIERLARVSHANRRPVQARYLMHSPDASLRTRIGELALRVKNRVRPLGLQRVGLPCGLYGTGMAFPWWLARLAPWASGHLVEDMELGVQLALRGSPPLYCDDASVSSSIAADPAGARSQRTRWEHGHLSLLRSAPRWLLQAARCGRWQAVALVLDLMVPPLALLATASAAATALTALAWAVAGWAAPLAVALAGLLMLVTAVLAARARYAADVVSTAELLQVPGYVLSKLPLYGRFLTRRQVEWVRTSRAPHGTR